MAICPDGREYSHYFNMLPKGVVFDATRQQFPRGTIFAPDGGIPRTQSGSGKDFGNTREYVLSYQAMLDRYVRLQQRFNPCRNDYPIAAERPGNDGTSP